MFEVQEPLGVKKFIGTEDRTLVFRKVFTADVDRIAGNQLNPHFKNCKGLR